MFPECPIPGAKGFAKLEGTGANGVLILGEALGEQELEAGGLPFRPNAPAGSILERAIRKLGYYRDPFLLWNAIPTHPPGNKLNPRWLAAAITWGQWHLEQVIRKYRPRAILALGNIPFQSASGLAGEGFNIGLVEGYTFRSPYGPTVVPSFHPAFMRRGAMSHFGCLLRDIGLALEIAREARPPLSAPDTPPPGYITFPTPVDAEWFFNEAAANHSLPLAYDIETPWSRSATEEESEDDSERGEAERRIESIQFSLRPGTGIFMPWREPYIPIAKRILALPNPKLGWNNWRFDDPRLITNDIWINGSVHDLMWAWHHLQPDLPRGLQFAAKFLGWLYPWKHLAASRPEFYGIVDCDALQTIVTPLFKALRETGIWTGYERHILNLEPILRRMSARGMPVSRDRFDAVKAELDTRVTKGITDIQALVPLPCKPMKIYKKTPKNTEGMIFQPVAKFDEAAGGFPERWHKILTWKPSNQALTKYTSYKGYDLPKDFESSKITFAQIHMKRLYDATKDPLYKAVLDYKEAQTVLSNHIANWQPDSSGRVHSTFYYDPATGQLSSRRPNIQNAPKHKAGTADLFRSMIRAEPGHTLIEFDFKGFHALMMGFEARDPDFIRLVRIDIHSFVTAHFFKVPGYEKAWTMTNDELRDYLAYVKKIHKWDRDAKIKHAVLGYNNGMGWMKLYNQYKEYFANAAEAKRVNAMLDHLFPVTAKFRRDVKIRAHEQGYLISRHGYIRRFFEVLKWTPDGLKPGGDQAEQAVSFLSSNDAFGHIKEVLLTLDSLGYLDKFGYINTVHDSLLFECPDPLIEECIASVKPIMTAPSKILIDPLVAPSGLSCGVSASLGKSWEAMREI